MKKTIFFILIFFFLSPGFVQAKGQGKGGHQKAIFFPPAPDQPRLQFLTSFSSSKDIEKPRGAFAEFILGPDVNQKSIIKPYGVRMRNGKIFICDTVLKGIEIINLQDRTFTYFRPKENLQLLDPINLDVLPNGNMYIADTGRGQVIVLDENGEFISSIGQKGQLKPTGVVVKDGKVYVCDLKSHSVRVYDAAVNKFLYSVPKANAPKKAHLYSPTNIDVDRDNNIYVTDTGGFDVKKFSAGGDFLDVIGKIGDTLGSFARPKGIAVDHDKKIYVVDASFSNVQVFNAKGQLLMFFPESGDDKVQVFLPAGICIDYDHVPYFRNMIDKNFEVEYLVLVASQYGRSKINVFGFGKHKAH